MPQLRIYRVFISHAWTYNEDYYRLENLLNGASNFQWHNYSVPQHDPLAGGSDKELEQQLRNQIQPTQVVLIISGMYTNYRKWIQKEIDIAQEWSKPIVGIRPWGSERIPQAVQDAAAEMVSWNTDSIVAAIRRQAL